MMILPHELMLILTGFVIAVLAVIWFFCWIIKTGAHPHGAPKPKPYWADDEPC